MNFASTRKGTSLGDVKAPEEAELTDLHIFEEFFGEKHIRGYTLQVTDHALLLLRVGMEAFLTRDVVKRFLDPEKADVQEYAAPNNSALNIPIMNLYSILS